MTAQVGSGDSRTSSMFIELSFHIESKKSIKKEEKKKEKTSKKKEDKIEKPDFSQSENVGLKKKKSEKKPEKKIKKIY